MRLLKWLFQPAYLLLIIVIIALYVNRETVFPQEVAESLEGEVLVAKIEDMTNGLREDIEEALDSSESVEEDTVEAANEEQVTVAEVETEEAASVETAPEEETAVAEVATATQAEEPVVEAVAEAEPSEIESTQPEPVIDAEPLPESAPEAPVETAEVAPSILPLALWQQARAAVWQGELNAAVAKYRELIALQPDNYDAYGEMGNVLLAQSKAAEAAEAYATAASLIYRSGNREIAFRVADIVLQLDPRRAEGLRQEFAR